MQAGAGILNGLTLRHALVLISHSECVEDWDGSWGGGRCRRGREGGREGGGGGKARHGKDRLVGQACSQSGSRTWN